MIVRFCLIALGVAIGVLIATALSFWPVMYNLRSIHSVSEFDWTDWMPLAFSIFFTAALAFGGGIAAKSIAERIEEREIENRAAEGRCFQCGYPLRGNTSGVCPECATRVAGPARSPTPSQGVRK